MAVVSGEAVLVVGVAAAARGVVPLLMWGVGTPGGGVKGGTAEPGDLNTDTDARFAELYAAYPEWRSTW